MILTDEFSRQAKMETDLGIPTALFAPPVRETIELGQSQIGFLNIFAYPLFQGVADVMPGMSFAIDELMNNKTEWESRIKAEQERAVEKTIFRRGRKDSEDEGSRRRVSGSILSPRQQSLASEKGTSSSGTGLNLKDIEMTEESDAVDSATSGIANLSVTAGRKQSTQPTTPSSLRQSTPVAQEPPYASSTIPTGNPSMEQLEEQATPPLHTVSGKMMATVQNEARAVLEFPRPESKSGRPVTAPSSSGAKGSDGAEDSIPKQNGNGHAISSNGNTNPQPSRPTHHRQRPSTSSTPMASRPVSDDLSHSSTSGPKPAANGYARGTASASASLMVPGEAKRDSSIVTTIRTLARKPSRRFRWWRKKDKEQAEDEEEVPVPVGVRIVSPAESELRNGAAVGRKC